jgi:hypothetical protein
MANRISDNKDVQRVFKQLLERMDKEDPGHQKQFKKDIAKYQSQKKKLDKLKPRVTKLKDPGMWKKAAVKAAKAPMAKKVAKKTVGKALGKLIPGVGVAAIAHDVLKGVSKATCSKRGGKWASGKCVGTKKTKFKPGSKVKDPISKR